VFEVVVIKEIVEVEVINIIVEVEAINIIAITREPCLSCFLLLGNIILIKGFIQRIFLSIVNLPILKTILLIKI
jgi:hypothetical protein